MKKSILLLATLAALAPSLPLTTNAATGPCGMNAAPQVYDLKADWSGTQNPNGAWSYRQGDSLLINSPIPWVGANYGGCGASILWPPSVPAVEKVNGIVKAYDCMLFVSDGYIEDGDVLVAPGIGGNILWTAPSTGTIDISGA